MRSSHLLLIWVLALGAVVPAVAVTPASPSGNPYADAIVSRNVFSLKPPPPPPDPNPVPKMDLPKITLQGLTTILGQRQVLMKVSTPPKPPDPAREESFVLSEGERQGEIEILAIDEVARTVKVKNHGVEQPLSMDKDAAKPPLGMAVAPPPGGPPGVPGVPPPGAMANPATPAVSGAGGVSTFGGSKTIPSRTLRVGEGTPAAGGIGVPAAGGSTAATPGTQGAGGSPEENVARYVINQAKNEELRKAGVPIPKTPPHPFLKEPPPTPVP